ncbi:hypothetical protein IE81DRAFT_67507 [Ceraceosorus guamensis]|uniref:C2 NT-type domain-containing protein n=1 Tax=Ceraceosorus guamensis TaxID=1522189 RepID=A0A316W7V3_9BASI|nr:hypothetical protein IE81DRAFT_67507 [Ceraceosorus guamensis]PWN43745.1 hypothetical protein IE81DRAFT_67507 [Ceraceosorus guamensis]
MTSLLSPFHFGQQRHAYFQLRVTIHELSNVPLVSGNFQARWKIRNAHGGGPHIPGAHHLPQLNTHANSKGKGKVKSAAEEVEEDDAASKGTHHRESTAEEDDPTLDAASTNAGLRGHAEAFGSRTEAATSSKGFLSKVLPGKRSADSSARHSPAADANSPASAYASLYSDSPRHGSSPRDSSDRHTSRSRPEDSPKQAPAASLAAKSSSAATEMQISEPRGETHFTRVRDHCASWERVVETGLRMTVEKPRNASGGSTSSANYPPASAGTSKEGFSTHLSPYGEPAKSNGRLHKSHSSRSLRTNQGAPEGHDASVGLLASRCKH